MKAIRFIIIFVISLGILFGGSWLLNNMIQTLPEALDAETTTAQEWEDELNGQE